MIGMFGIEIKVGDTCATFLRREANEYSGILGCEYFLGKVIKIEPLPHDKERAIITVEENEYTEDTLSNFPEVKSKKVINEYFNDGVFNYSALRDVIPEHFL